MTEKEVKLGPAFVLGNSPSLMASLSPKEVLQKYVEFGFITQDQADEDLKNILKRYKKRRKT